MKYQCSRAGSRLSKSGFRENETPKFLKFSLYKKVLRSKQTSLPYTHFDTCANYKKMTPLKLKISLYKSK